MTGNALPSRASGFVIYRHVKTENLSFEYPPNIGTGWGHLYLHQLFFGHS